MQKRPEVLWKRMKPFGFRRFPFVCYQAITVCIGVLLSVFIPFLALGHGSLSNTYTGPFEDKANAVLLSPVEDCVNTPNITVRFIDPVFDCETEEYCVKVQFQSDLPNQQLFGMNVRFFYEDLVLEFISFRNFESGYGPVAPDPPQILTSPPAFGYNYFGFGEPDNGPADWFNGAIQLVDPGQSPIYLSTTDWTTLFEVCFTIDDPSPDSTGFCPPIVWDLEVDPENGGYLAGDDGVVITVVDEQTGLSAPASESVEQFNWTYTGGGVLPPFGTPVETHCIPFACGLDLQCPADVSIGCGQSTLPSHTGLATSDDACPGQPVITYADSIVAGECGSPGFIIREWTVSDSCSNVSTCLQIISIIETGTICGQVLDDLNQPIGGVEIQLIADLNNNSQLDEVDTLVIMTISDALTGDYCFNGVEPCAYILSQVLPEGYVSLSDYDHSADPDGDDSVDGPDSEIPVSMSACESDSGNIFINLLCPAQFPTVSPDTICEDESVVLQASDPNGGLCTYAWNFGSGATPPSAVGLGPHVVLYNGTPENLAVGADVMMTISRPGCPDTSQSITEIWINAYPDATINGSTQSGCYYTERIFMPMADSIPGALYEWHFGDGAVPPSAIGYGPHSVYYQTTGAKNVSLTISPNAPGAQCIDSAFITFVINACPASVSGHVKSTANEPITGVNLRLYKDADTNGIADNDTIVRSVFTNSAGNYVMSSLVPGHYVIIQVQPNGWISIDDGDPTEDGDIVVNTDSLDNLIPSSLMPGEIDAINFFMELGMPGTIAGSVFNDQDQDQYPDAGEGLNAVTLTLYSDSNSDGIADGIIPIATALTDPDGSFLFSNVTCGHYVLGEEQPSAYYSQKDMDASNDNDVASNSEPYDDFIPVTVTNDEDDDHNYFIETDSCSLIVMNTSDAGLGSLRLAINCADAGDTIRFDPALAGQTIHIQSARLLVDKDIVILSDITPTIHVKSGIPGLFTIPDGTTTAFQAIDITSGLAGYGGAAFLISGIVHLTNIDVYRHESLPSTEIVIRINPTGQLFIEGSCLLGQ